MMGSSSGAKPRPKTVCPKCRGWMERRVAIREATQARFWHDADPLLRMEGCEVHHYICTKCGRTTTHQIDTRIRLAPRPGANARL